MTVKPGWRGRFFEDFEVGDVYQHPLGRTITEADNIWFTLLTMNTAEIHFNTEAAKDTEFGRPLVNSALTLAISAGQSVIDTSYNAVANLSWEAINLVRPVFAGDTLWSETVVLFTRESRSRPDAGIVRVKTRALNQDGEEVLSFTRTFLAYKRAAARNNRFPRAATPLVPPVSSS